MRNGRRIQFVTTYFLRNIDSQRYQNAHHIANVNRGRCSGPPIDSRGYTGVASRTFERARYSSWRPTPSRSAAAAAAAVAAPSGTYVLRLTSKSQPRHGSDE